MAAKTSLIKVDGHKIENVRQFTYLGHMFDNRDETSSTEHRKARASIIFEKRSGTSMSTEGQGGSF